MNDPRVRAAALVIATAVTLVAAPGASALPAQAESEARDPAAVALMQQADAALEAATALEFDYDLTGTFARSARTTGHAVVVLTDNPADLRYRASVDVHVQPAILRNLGRRLEVANDGETIWLIDHDAGEVQLGSAAGGAQQLQMPINQFVMPMMFRPLQGVEIDLPEQMTLAGRAQVGGVECDVVYLDFPDDSGYGQQYFYIGRQDRLPRRIVLTAAPNGNFIQFDFTMTDLRVVEPTAEMLRLEPPGGYAVLDDAMDVAPGALAEDIELTPVDGEPVRLEQLRGKVVVLDFWASWCPICRNQMPTVSNMAAKMADLPVEFFAVNAWENGDPLAFVEELGVDLPVVLEGDELAQRYRVVGTATLVIIDPEGRFRPRVYGNPTPEALEAAIRDALETSTTTASAPADQPSADESR